MYALVLDNDWTGQDQVRAVLLGARDYVQNATCLDPYNQYWLAKDGLTEVGERQIEDCQFGNRYGATVYRVVTQ